jgi:succinate dehydrogenase hydrophobic anchor subunit
MHIKRVHYVELGQPILYAGVALRLKDVMTLALDSSILFLGLFHGLNGVRMVALDYDFLKKHDRLISWLLIIVGAAFFVLGVKGLWAFLIDIRL